MNTIILGIVLAVALPVCFIFYHVIRLIARDGASVVYANPENPKWRTCNSCEGCGVVMDDGSPIPLEHRSFYKSVKTGGMYEGVIQGPIANTKTCIPCGGFGSYWIYKDILRNRLPF